MPIRYDAPPREIEKLFNSLNGILFTGGGTDIRDLNSTYMRTASQLLKATLAAHAKGNRVPLWYFSSVVLQEAMFAQEISLPLKQQNELFVCLSQGHMHGLANTLRSWSGQRRSLDEPWCSSWQSRCIFGDSMASPQPRGRQGNLPSPSLPLLAVFLLSPPPF